MRETGVSGAPHLWLCLLSLHEATKVSLVNFNLSVITPEL